MDVALYVMEYIYVLHGNEQLQCFGNGQKEIFVINHL